ncbi:DNL zinc finger-domain-containing protein [Blastocladiella britannica]|nr:DNL zinc finger-domain-containing protein [Blastocladiella britannica]
MRPTVLSLVRLASVRTGVVYASRWHHFARPVLLRSLSSSSSTPLSVSNESPNAGNAERSLLVAFTCKVCSTRVSKTVTRNSYENGVVLIRCDGCQNVHLIADNKGWFLEGRNAEEILQKQNPDEQVGKMEFRAKDAAGQAILDRLMKEDPGLLDRIARAKLQAKATGQPTTLKMVLPATEEPPQQ